MFLLLLRSYTSFSSSRPWRENHSTGIHRCLLGGFSQTDIKSHYFSQITATEVNYVYHLEGSFFRGAEFDTFIYESVEVALADVGGNFGPEFRGDDRPLHRRTLEKVKKKIIILPHTLIIINTVYQMPDFGIWWQQHCSTLHSIIYELITSPLLLSWFVGKHCTHQHKNTNNCH